MARGVYFSFHFERDIWRVNQIRSIPKMIGTAAAGFLDESLWEEVKKGDEAVKRSMTVSDEAIKRMVVRRLERTTVTVVLIGTHTSERPWVRHEVEQSISRKNGLLGVHIHHLKDEAGETSLRGLKPAVPPGTPFPAYDWDHYLDRFKREIEAAGVRADMLRSVQA